MKTIFPQPIGTLRDLGTPREWITDLMGCALIAGAVAVLLFLL